jgi:hypothetical protein
MPAKISGRSASAGPLDKESQEQIRAALKRLKIS